jgi:HSP20 family protein
MLLTTFDPAAEFDRIARRAFAPAGPGRAPIRMDAIRHQQEVELRFDLPGIDADSLDVTVDRGVLTVSASRSEEYAENEKPFVRERVMGTFSRQIRLSDSVDAENIEAAYEAGVLTVRVPLQEQAQPRKVEVKAPGRAELTA